MKHVGLPRFFYQKPANEMFWYFSQIAGWNVCSYILTPYQAYQPS